MFSEKLFEKIAQCNLKKNINLLLNVRKQNIFRFQIRFFNLFSVLHLQTCLHERGYLLNSTINDRLQRNIN